MVIYGKNTVLEALKKNKDIIKLYVTSNNLDLVKRYTTNKKIETCVLQLKEFDKNEIITTYIVNRNMIFILLGR